MKKLYYQDAYIRSFQTDLISQSQDLSGKYYAILEETAFYPEGGGQPYDRGTLNGQAVMEVQEVDGEVRHYLEQPLPETTHMVTGELNWARRFDHMQQHTGQHLLSAALEELFSYKTLSFHLGKEVSTIDIDTQGITESELTEAEALVNTIILENRDIHTKWVTQEELINYPLRKELSVSENIRLVIIPEFDYNGCGGTHPNKTGGVGSLKILSFEKQRKLIRITFVAGHRVLKQLQEKQKVLSDLSVQLNASQNNMVDAVTRLLNQSKDQARELKEAKEILLQFEATALTTNIEVLEGNQIIKEKYSDRPINDLQSIARYLVNKSDEVNVLLVAENNDKLAFVLARGNNSIINMKDVAKSVFPVINGKGGGKESFVQGGGDATITAEECIKLLVKSIK